MLLALAGVMSYVDRIVINLLIVPIQADLKLTDTEFAGLQGIAFGLFYCLASFPLGRLADNLSRRKIVIFGLAGFSIFSMLSGAARNYWQLFIARAGVGVGEATLNPSAYSMLSDYFPPHKLGRAIGAFTMSVYLGYGLAFIAGGLVIGWLSQPGLLESTFLSAYEPWQVTFFIVGLPGLILLIPICLLLREPKRRGAGNSKPLPLRDVGRRLWSFRRVLVPLLGGFAITVIPAYATAVWTPALFIRVHDWTPAQVGVWYGLLYMGFGVGGTFFAGWMSDRLTARGVLDAPIKVAAFGFIGFGVFGGLAPLMPTPGLALIMFAPATFCMTMPAPLGGTALQMIIPNRMRAQTTAIYVMVVNVVGLGLGPLIVGGLTDYVFRRPADVQYSLAIVNAVSAPVAMILFLLSAGAFRRLRIAQRDELSKPDTRE